MSDRKDRLIKRLSSYWVLEALNVFIVPAFMVFLARGNIGFLSVVAILPMCLLLVIGAAYWRAKLKQLQGDRRALRAALGWIGPMQWVARVSCIMAAAAAVTGWVQPDLSAGRADQWVATSAATLAVLEYINYYYRQLQHFDHADDFKRLTTGKGFRRSQMAVDLKAYRNRHTGK